MSERGYAPITVIPLLKAKTLSAGDSATSDPIDLRESVKLGVFSISYSATLGTAGTLGTSTFTYLGCPTHGGEYVCPAGTVGNSIGSCGTGGTKGIMAFKPELMPFMKIVTTQEGTGNAGKDSVITAELIVQ